MKKFTNVFGKKHCPIIGMIHTPALPGKENPRQNWYRDNKRLPQHIKGTPNYDGNFQNCIDRVRYEANMYKKHKIVSVAQQIYV